jgi:hypothetical protein
MTQAVGEISKDDEAEGSTSNTEPLEFINSAAAVLDLDADVQKGVHLLKRSLLGYRNALMPSSGRIHVARRLL